MRRAWLGVLLLACTAVVAAHDVPNDVRIQIFLRPEGQRLHLLVRAPLAAMNDVSWPVNGLFLDLAHPEMSVGLREGATDWMAGRIEIHEGDTRLPPPRLLAARVALPSDTSFDSFERARQSVLGPPLPPSVELAASQAMVDALFEYPIGSERSRFSIDPHYRILGLRSLTVLRFLTPDGAERALEFHDDPGLVRLDPSWGQAVRLFTGEGFRHILGGIDHLLFLFCLVIPFRRFGQLLVVVTAFTVAHSITLVASAYGMAPAAAWFPPAVETVIAASILYMALENIVSPGLGRRWIIAFGFGLVHGFGFSFALRDTLQLAGAHLVTSLLAFNAGVELGQVAVLLVLIPALSLIFRYVAAERIGTIVLSALVAHTAWHWTIERGELLSQYPFALPDFTPAFFVWVLRWLMVAVGVSGLWWLGRVVLHRRRAGGAVHTG